MILAQYDYFENEGIATMEADSFELAQGQKKRNIFSNFSGHGDIKGIGSVNI